MSRETPSLPISGEQRVKSRLTSARTNALEFVFAAKDRLRRKSYWAESEGELVLASIKKHKEELEQAFDEWVEQPERKYEHESEDATVASVDSLIKELKDVEQSLIENGNFYKG